VRALEPDQLGLACGHKILPGRWVAGLILSTGVDRRRRA
jgi:hypothetical protein